MTVCDYTRQSFVISYGSLPTLSLLPVAEDQESNSSSAHRNKRSKQYWY